ncbi:MAG: hypothetical protein RL481_1648 [Pseudomonadota bacterium]|jgi:uncharacterized repeat protein (TIGR01451 family)
MNKFLNLNIAYSAALIGSALFGSLLAAGSARAQTANQVIINSEAQIERTETMRDGKERVIYKKPGEVIVVPGDKVVFTLKYANVGGSPATGFTATNPMPGPVQFLTATEDWAEVSVDGGKSWGVLSSLTVKIAAAEGQPEGTRAATAEDVTHVRWVFRNPIAPGAKGAISYRGMIK